MPQKKRPTPPPSSAHTDTTTPATGRRTKKNLDAGGSPASGEAPKTGAAPAPKGTRKASTPKPTAASAPPKAAAAAPATGKKTAKRSAGKPAAAPVAPSAPATEPFVDRQAPSASVQATPAVPAAAAPVKPAPAPALGHAKPSAPAGGNRLSILMVTTESHPFARTGGLAEVAAALPRALAAMGHDVTVVLPRYRGIDTSGASSTPVTFRLGEAELSLTVFERTLPEGVTLALVDAPDLFDREGLYGDAAGDYGDNAWRFAAFGRAAIEFARARGVRPSVIHAHDWQTGLVPVYQKMLFSADPVVGGVPVVFTIHNLAFQGNFPPSTLGAIGLGWDVMDIQAMEYWGQVSYLKGGINFSERITTVSPTYASEITQPDLGFGFEGVLQRRAGDLSGILNGVDTARWNPAADAFVPAAFTADDLTGKVEAKRALLEAAGIARDSRAPVRPLIGLLSRLTDQKGFDLIAAAVDELMSLDASWVLLGSGEQRYEDLWRSLAARHPGRISATIGFDERLAHLIVAGADLFLMPSRFEPCGLNQLHSLRYGTVPIVRATGGLKDTVEDGGEGGQGTGFTFGQYTPGALVAAVRRALAAQRNADLWQAMQRRGMKQDRSWNASAREYVKVYEALTGAPRAGRQDIP